MKSSQAVSVRKRLSGLALSLGVLALMSCVTVAGAHYAQGGLVINAVEIEIHRNGTAWQVSGLSAHSGGSAITRFACQIGIDANKNGVLEASEIQVNVDNPTPSADVVLGSLQGPMSQGETVIVHVEVYQGGTDPVYSHTWSASS